MSPDRSDDRHRVDLGRRHNLREICGEFSFRISAAGALERGLTLVADGLDSTVFQGMEIPNNVRTPIA